MSEPRRIVFLDFDGVLNNNNTDGVWGKLALEPDCIAVLNEVVAKTPNILFVISSAWRAGKPVHALAQMLDGWGFQGRVIDKTPEWQNDEFRGLEIQDWIDVHGRPDDIFLALDDARCYKRPFFDMRPQCVNGRLLDVDPKTGLTPAHIPEILKRLKVEVTEKAA